MSKKKNSNKNSIKNDPPRFESTYGMALQPEDRPLPSGLSVQPVSPDGDAPIALYGFSAAKSGGGQMWLLPCDMAAGELRMGMGWVNFQPCFLLTGGQEDLATIQSLPILVLRPGVFLSQHGALLSLELDLHESEQPVGHWTMMLDPLVSDHTDFLRALAAQQEISLILAPAPLDANQLRHRVYRVFDPIGNQITQTMDKALRQIQRLKVTDSRAVQLHYLYWQLHQND